MPSMTKQADAVNGPNLGCFTAANDLPPLPYQVLPKPHPLRLSAAHALRQLRRYGVRCEQIRALISRLQVERDRDSIVASWPTAGEDRASLAEISDLATQLHRRLGALSQHAKMRLQQSYLHAYPTDAYTIYLVNRYPWALAVASGLAAKSMPLQSRRSSNANVVAAVAACTAPLGIRPSAAAGSRFYKACVAAFELADITIERDGCKRRASPDGSIRAYLRQMVKTDP